MRRKSPLTRIIIVVVLIAVAFMFFGNVGYKIFAQKTFEGTVENCESLNPGQIISGKDMNDKVFSFSLSVDVGDEFVTFSSEDRQFATVKSGDRVKFKVFKYPPWDFTKGGTHYSGRLLKKYKK
jgi:hypothetical protein